MIGEWLLCDFHIHTTYSDGKLSLRDVVDTYGGNDFDVISITDHVLDMRTVEKLEKKNGAIKSLRKEGFEEYLHILWEEARRAWEQHNTLLIPGVELTNEHDQYHILAIDIKKFIDPLLLRDMAPLFLEDTHPFREEHRSGKIGHQEQQKDRNTVLQERETDKPLKTEYSVRPTS